WLLGRRDEALDGTASLTVGHTRLAVDIDGERLRLRPSGHVALLPSVRGQLPPQVSWDLQARNLWRLPVSAANLAWCAALAALLAGVAGWIAAARAAKAARRRAFAATAANTMLALGGMALLAMQRSGSAPGAGIAAMLGACALFNLMLGTGRLRLVPAVAALLLGIGLLAQLELGLGASDSAALRHVSRSAALAAVGLGLLPLLRHLAPRVPIRQAMAEWLLLSAAGIALSALLLQAAIGDETGVLDVQPVEFAKLALIALTAHCLALARGSVTSAPAWLRILAPAALFIVLLAVALIQVDDYSPLVLLLVWAATMAFAWTLASGNKRLAGMIAALCCTGAVAVAAVQQEAPGRVESLQFYGDRFQVWLDPEGHPHTGQQVLRAAGAIASGGTWGADDVLGLASLGQRGGDALRIPAVQDDFAPSFFLNRHGIAGGIVLWLLQSLFVAGLTQLAVRHWQASAATRDFRSAWLERLRCFVSAGGAGFVAGHLLLSWGTNLGILPVMGQPMSFLSAGGSHLLFFICPLLVFAATSAESFEENESCRSTSNMKPLAR
ncbi:MAG TPA: FtsW/RodA/SpoVE family cell cycle protein, partial [Telluria sp.]|nr:FtsW/RodA/SpoVE family cell cycle protein [Telluria sp.]